MLRARLDGDLAGISQWTVVRIGDGGSLAVFDEEVDVHKRHGARRRAARPARAALQPRPDDAFR